MTGSPARDESEVSLFALGTTLVRYRWRIARWALAGALIGAVYASTKPRVYIASASFVPQRSDAGPSGLLSLAGQFGVTLPLGDASRSPAFYAALLKSRVLLMPIVRDTFVVVERGAERLAFSSLARIGGADGPRRDELALRSLERMVRVSVANNTGIVQLNVVTRWPSVSLAIADTLLQGLNQFNLQTRRSEAGAERQFVEQRLKVASAELQAAEDSLTRFLLANRRYSQSPDLAFQVERLRRTVALQNQVFTTLTQSYEEARIREVRDTPLITVVEPPGVPPLPAARRRVFSTLLGFFLGGLGAVLVALTTGLMDLRRQQGDRDYEQFVGALREARGRALLQWQGLKKRLSS